MAEFNEQGGEADESDIKDIKKLMRKAEIYRNGSAIVSRNC